MRIWRATCLECLANRHDRRCAAPRNVTERALGRKTWEIDHTGSRRRTLGWMAIPFGQKQLKVDMCMPAADVVRPVLPQNASVGLATGVGVRGARRPLEAWASGLERCGIHSRACFFDATVLQEATGLPFRARQLYMSLRLPQG